MITNKDKIINKDLLDHLELLEKHIANKNTLWASMVTKIIEKTYNVKLKVDTSYKLN